MKRGPQHRDGWGGRETIRAACNLYNFSIYSWVLEEREGRYSLFAQMHKTKSSVTNMPQYDITDDVLHTRENVLHVLYVSENHYMHLPVVIRSVCV